MKRLTPALLGVVAICSVTLASVSQNQFVVLFPTDSFTLDAKALRELDKTSAFARQGTYYEVLVDAHTDNAGSDNYNIELSKKRAVSVVKYLVSQGIDEKKITFDWFGEKKPVKPNSTVSGMQANRRVTIAVSVYDWTSANDILKELSDNRQEFSIDPGARAVLAGKAGLKIEIPEDAFVNADGSPISGDNVNVILTEALTRESWLTEGLSTLSPQGILESGGMFKLEAVQNGQPLAVKADKQLSMQMPFESPSLGMALYVASADDRGNMVWDKSAEPVTTRMNAGLPALQIEILKLDALIEKYRNMQAGYMQVDSAFFSLTPQPEFTQRPPRMPKKPVKESIRLNITGIKKFLMTKKHEKELIEKVYEKKMKSYEKNMAYYNRPSNIITGKRKAMTRRWRSSTPGSRIITG